MYTEFSSHNFLSHFLLISPLVSSLLIETYLKNDEVATNKIYLLLTVRKISGGKNVRSCYYGFNAWFVLIVILSFSSTLHYPLAHIAGSLGWWWKVLTKLMG